MWPVWVEFVVGSRPCCEGFSLGNPVFLPPQKPTFLKSNLTCKTYSGKKSYSVDSTGIPIVYLIIYSFPGYIYLISVYHMKQAIN